MKNWRILLILVIFFGCGAALTSRLFYLQIFQHKFYQAQALGQQAGFLEITGKRGQIFFQDSQDSKGSYGTGAVKNLAINKQIWTLALIPGNSSNQENINKLLTLISKILGTTEKDLIEKIKDKKTYTIIKKNLSDNELLEFKKIKSQDLDNILVLDSFESRYYPQAVLGSHVIGFVNGESAGQYGIEGYYDDILKGKTGIIEQKRSLGLAGTNQDQDNLDGSDIYLTLDPNIQFQAESLLKEAKETVKFDSGQIIVMKPDSGRILAMADYPFFDPNNYSKEKDMAIFQNSAVQKLFEPGSVIKPFTMASAINEGKINSKTTYTDSGTLKIGPDTIYNFDHKKYGLQTMTGVLEKSINTGAVFAQKTLDANTYLSYLDRYGFNQKTGIDLQGEVSSENNILKQGREINLATSSFGQGIEMTPIRLATSFCVFANGGKMITPYVVEKIVHGSEQKKTEYSYTSQVFSQQTSLQVQSMLNSVIDNGFGKLGQLQGYYLAGKTGTAQVPIPGGAGYYPSDVTIQTFIGFGPTSNPQFLIMVKLDNPKTSASSLSSAPIFRKMANYIVNYWHIPPDYEK